MQEANFISSIENAGDINKLYPINSRGTEFTEGETKYHITSQGR